MDTCSKCSQPAKYFRRVGADLSFTCDQPQHLRAQGGDTNDWRGVGAMGGGLLLTAKLAEREARSALRTSGVSGAEPLTAKLGAVTVKAKA